jgi:polyhydroxyalkanoate synthesis regulator phasin
MKKILPIVLFLCTFLISSIALCSIESPVVISYAGDVQIFPIGNTIPILCKPGMFIDQGTLIKTGEESYVEIAFDKSKKNFVKIIDNSDVVLKLDGPEKIELIDGKIFTFLKEVEKGQSFRVRTPSAVCGARGTGWMTEHTGAFTEVAVFDSKVFVRGLKEDGSVMEEELWVETGFKRKIERFSSPGKTKKVSKERLQEMKNEFVSDEQIREEIAKKLQNLTKKAEKKQERIEGIIERKLEDRLDKIKEEKKDDDQTEYSIRSET